MTKDDISSYKGTAPYIFISYSHTDTDRVMPFIKQFQADGYRVWFDEGVEVGREWAVNIVEHLNNSACMVAFMTQNYLNSDNCLDEIEHAKNKKITTLIIYLDDIDVPDWFSMRHRRTQAIFCSHYKAEIKLFQRIYETTVMNKCLIDNKNNFNSENYFKENAVMEGSVLRNFKGRLSAHVVIPEGVTVIGARAFAFYSDLLGITIPASVNRIDEYAFINCHNLSSITVSPNNPIFYSEGNCCIERATKRLVFGCHTSIIPDGVAVIGEDSFNGCKRLTHITIPDSVVHIEASAFFECTGLKRITLPDGVADIGFLAFGDCSSLVDLMIPATVISISNTAFYGCAGLESIRVAPGNPMYYSECNCCIETNTRSLALGCQNSTIPDNIVNIGADAFGGCIKLGKITIPGCVKEIGYEAFCGCKNLTTVIIDDGVERIGAKSFMGCSSLKELNIPSSVSEVENLAFSDCSSISAITVAADNMVYRSEDNCLIKRKDNVLVRGCMKSIIPDGITEIGDDAFCGCAGLTDVYLPESITKIGDNAFAESGLTGVTISESVIYIGSYAFHECDNLTSVVIPSNVKYIGELAFSSYNYVNREIFCEASKKPGRWHREWTDDSIVYWKDEWNYDENRIPVVRKVL